MKNKIYQFVNKEQFAEKVLPYGWFHLMWFTLTIIIITLLLIVFKKPSRKTNKKIFIAFYVPLLLVEILKQFLAVGPNFNTYENSFFPYMLCSMPLYITPIYFAIPNKYEKTQDVFLSYFSIYNLWCGAFVMFYPGDVFASKSVFICCHTMIYHGILAILGVYSVGRSIVKWHWQTYMWASLIFTIGFLSVMLGNEIIYHIGDNSKVTPNLWNISHRKLSPFAPPVKLDNLKPILFTLLYLPFTIFSTSLIYSIAIGIKIAFEKIVSLVAQKITFKNNIQDKKVC